jgi:hypothetical protein
LLQIVALRQKAQTKIGLDQELEREIRMGLGGWMKVSQSYFCCKSATYNQTIKS